jgi:hypothetical protein
MQAPLRARQDAVSPARTRHHLHHEPKSAASVLLKRRAALYRRGPCLGAAEGARPCALVQLIQLNAVDADGLLGLRHRGGVSCRPCRGL